MILYNHSLRLLTLTVGHDATMGNRGRRFTLGMTAATKHERLLSCLVSDSAKKVNFGIQKFVYLHYASCINYVNR